MANKSFFIYLNNFQIPGTNATARVMGSKMVTGTCEVNITIKNTKNTPIKYLTKKGFNQFFLYLLIYPKTTKMATMMMTIITVIMTKMITVLMKVT